MQDTEDLYELLQVNPNAEPEVVQAAYRCLVFKYYPDRNPSPRATHLMQALNSAYEVLSDPTRRARYNSARNANNAAVAEPTSESHGNSEEGTTPSSTESSVTEPSVTEPSVADPHPANDTPPSPTPSPDAVDSGEIDFTFSYPAERPRFGFRLPSWVIILIALAAIGGFITDLVL